MRGLLCFENFIFLYIIIMQDKTTPTWSMDCCAHDTENQQWLPTDDWVTWEEDLWKKRIARVLIAVLVGWWIASWYLGTMLQFMWWFFIVVGCLKLLDLPWFVKGYRKYDLVAAEVKRYGRLYPFFEVGFWLSLLLWHEVTKVLYTIILFMFVWAIWVGIKLAKREKFKCACLWTKINVPLTNLTLVEDLLMAVMAIMLLLS